MATKTGINIYINGLKHNVSPRPDSDVDYDISDVVAPGESFDVQFSNVYDTGESELTPVQTHSLAPATAAATTSRVLSPYEGEKLSEDDNLYLKFSTVIDEPYVVDADSYTGATDSDKIEAATEDVNTHGGGTIQFNRDYNLDRAILISSNITYDIATGCTIMHKDRVFDNVFRTEGVIPDPANPNHLALYVHNTENFKILGAGVGSTFIKGAVLKKVTNDTPYGTQDVEWTGDNFGWRTILIGIWGGRNYEIGQFSMGNASAWSISNDYNIYNGHYHDIHFDSPNVGNGDGINIRSGCDTILIENITGLNNDDLIPLNTLWRDNPLSGDAIYPTQPMGNNKLTPKAASIKNITINNIEGDTKTQVFRILAAGGAQVYNINLTDVRDKLGGQFATYRVVRIQEGTGYAEGYHPNDIRNITIQNLTSYTSQVALAISGQCDNVHVDNVQYVNGQALLITNEPTNSSFTNIQQITV